MHGKFYPWRSVDADNHIEDGSKSGRNSLRQPYDRQPNMPYIGRNQYGTLRDGATSGFHRSISDGATDENPTKNETYGDFFLQLATITT